MNETSTASWQTDQVPVGHGLLVPSNGWSFGGHVWRRFDQHIRASVPGYDALHDCIVDLARGFLGPRRRACDLGCATGTLTARLAREFRGAELVGVDIEPAMIAAAKRLSPTRPLYCCEDIRAFELGELSLATACYTLMFLPPEDRLTLLRRVHAALMPGGALVLAEKVIRRNPVHEARCQKQHHAFKRRQGLSEQEISNKSESIKGQLVPLHDDENVALLEQAGFSDVELVFRAACFDAWIAVP